jgi:hypothetical protein|tara:strand:- start:154 stop:348 length:195 start_codon:yes stop_codon:yes gene_type:complete
MKITQAVVREVKIHLKKNWHDQAWHDYNGLPVTQAVTFALMSTPKPQHLRDIVAEAKKDFIYFK